MSTVNLFQHEHIVDGYTSGQAIFREGDPGDALYGVLEGEVEIRHREAVLEIVTPGGIFGEMALIDDKPRSATAVARTDCRVAFISRKRFAFLVQQTPNFALVVMRVMAGRLRQQTERSLARPSLLDLESAFFRSLDH